MSSLTARGVCFLSAANLTCIKHLSPSVEHLLMVLVVLRRKKQYRFVIVVCVSIILRTHWGWKKCPTFGRRHLHIYFRERECTSLHWRHYDHDGVSNYQPHGCLLNCLFRRRSKKTSKLRVTGLLCREFTEAGEFPAQRASYAENVSIWWCHHVFYQKLQKFAPKNPNNKRSALIYRKTLSLTCDKPLPERMRTLFADEYMRL